MTSKRAPRIELTEVFWVIDSPKSKWTAPVMKSMYCDGSERSSPSCSFSVATAFGVAWAPRMIRTGSPGTR